MLARTLLALATLLPLALAVLPIPQFSLGGKDVQTFADWTWSDCGDESFAIQITEIQVTPDPPEPGKALTVNVTGVARSPIEEGSYADVTVKLGLIQLLKKRFDVCEEATNANLTIQCPVESGTYNVANTVELPKEIPKAKFGVQVRGVTADDDDMVCLDIVMNFLSRRT